MRSVIILAFMLVTFGVCLVVVIGMILMLGVAGFRRLRAMSGVIVRRMVGLMIRAVIRMTGDGRRQSKSEGNNWGDKSGL